MLSGLRGDRAALRWTKWNSRGEKTQKCGPSWSRLSNWCVMPSVKCNRPEFNIRAFIPPDTNPGNVSSSVSFPNYILPMWKVSIHKLDCHSKVQDRPAPTLHCFAACEGEWRLKVRLVVRSTEDTRISSTLSTVCFYRKLQNLLKSQKHSIFILCIFIISLNLEKAYVPTVKFCGFNYTFKHRTPCFYSCTI